MVKKVRPIPLKKLIAALTLFCLIGLLPALAAADLTPGTLDTGFSVGTGTDNAVLALAIQPDGGILLGGSLNQETGVLSGTPKQVGIFTLTLSAYNQYPPTAAQTFTLTVDKAHYFVPLILRH